MGNTLFTIKVNIYNSVKRRLLNANSLSRKETSLHFFMETLSIFLSNMIYLFTRILRTYVKLHWLKYIWRSSASILLGFGIKFVKTSNLQKVPVTTKTRDWSFIQEEDHLSNWRHLAREQQGKHAFNRLNVGYTILYYYSSRFSLNIEATFSEYLERR